MVASQDVHGWQIQHHERLFYRANSGSPTIILKFFHYPVYRQTVQINQFPSKCKLQVKGNNSFFLFKEKVRTKGSISLDRTISVFPTLFPVNLKDDWGNISEIPQSQRTKYRESSKYWPIHSSSIQKISGQDWFNLDDLRQWVLSASQYIRTTIKHRENQEERLGAYQAFHHGIGDCDEFTDLFITLTRMREIPCRRLTGCYIANKGLLTENHAWGEVLTPELGWIPIDIALNDFGHSINYIILKIEEFNPALPDYHIQTKHTANVHYQWEKPDPEITPILSKN